MGLLGKKTKGEIAELAVAAKLIEGGWRVLFPFGENNRYDLVIEKANRFLRVQVKYVTPKNGAMEINCRSSNNWSVIHYSPKDIDVLAVYNPQGGYVYFIPSDAINHSSIKLRLRPSKNNQHKDVNFAEHYLALPI